MNILNQFSFVIAVAIVGIIFVLFLTTRRSWSPVLRVGLILGVVVIAIGISVAFRYPSSDSIDTADDLEAIIHNGRPTFIMLYSNY